MATLSTQVIAHAGTVATYDPAGASGDSAAPGAGVLLHVKNGDASSHTVTLVTPGTVDGLDVANRDVVIPAGQDAYIPILNLYRDPSTGLASVTYDAVTSVTVAVLRVS